MISLKKYLDSLNDVADIASASDEALLAAYQDAFRSALLAIGNASVKASPSAGAGLQASLAGLESKLVDAGPRRVASTGQSVREQVDQWGDRAAHSLEERADEVRNLLLLLARTSESLAHRDQRCAQQIGEVTSRLKSIASLDDIRQIRSSIEKSATDLKASIERMTAEGKSAVDHLRVEVKAYRTRLEEAEYIASFDGLTRLGNRLWIETQIQNHITCGQSFSVVLLDIDGFKWVNDNHGHLAGDEVLKQFAAELKRSCRAGDTPGRWGGDEFIVLVEGDIEEAHSQAARMRQWICGNYTIEGDSGPFRHALGVSIGVAEFKAGDSLQTVLHRADQEMYRDKAGKHQRATA